MDSPHDSALVSISTRQSAVSQVESPDKVILDLGFLIQKRFATHPLADAPDQLAWLEKTRDRVRRNSIRVGASFIERSTHSSYQLDGVTLPPGAVREAMNARAGKWAMRPRTAQRIRNHASIQFQIERMLRRRIGLSAGTLVRWYTSLSTGLCGTQMQRSEVERLESVAARVNVTPHRVGAALDQVAALQVELLSEPVVPSFSGIFARLVLHMHLGRCGLPPVVMDSGVDSSVLKQPSRLSTKLAEMVARSYEQLAA